MSVDQTQEAVQGTSLKSPHSNDLWGPSNGRKDFFSVHRDGPYAGKHLLVDLIGAQRLDDIELVKTTLQECTELAGATLLHIHAHRFTPNGGISGVAVLSESHISLHSWPEVGYAALDIFMCGAADPYAGIAALERAFSPQRVNVREILRGQGDIG